MPREINDAGYKLIKEFEAGPRGNSLPALTPYYCPAGKLTNGWGNTHNVVPGTLITTEQAEMDLERNLDWAEECVEKYTPNANSNEFAAMVSLTFNIGAATQGGFPSSTVCRLHNKGDKAGAAAAFAMWRKMIDPNSGQLVDSAGLLRRRNVEANLYLTPVIAALDRPAMPQVVAPEKTTASSKSVIAGGVTVAAGAASVTDQLSQVQPLIDKITTVGMSMQSLMKLGAVALSMVALAAGAYMLVRYIQKKRRGEIVSS